MKRFLLLLSILAVIILLLPSCAAFYQRAYVANAPNVNCFEKDNEKNLKFSLFLNHFEVQSNYVLAKQWGMSACINGGFRGQFGGELGGIYYKRFNDKHYFETQVGYGYTNNNTYVDVAWSLMASEKGRYYSRTTDVRYHKIFLQPTYFTTDATSNVNYGLALKICANYFDNYYYRYDITEGNDNGGYSMENTESAFRYKWNLTFEPSVKILIKKKLYFQLSGIFSTNAGKSTFYQGNYTHEGHPIGDVSEVKVGNPQHIAFLFTIGYEIKMGKKKENVPEVKMKPPYDK